MSPRQPLPLWSSSLQWRHNEHNGVSNSGRLLNRFFRCRSKKISKPRVSGLCEGNSPVTGEFPAQRGSNAKKVPIWWRHHGAREFHFFLGCKNPVAFYQYDDELEHGQHSCWYWPWTLQQISDETSIDGTSPGVGVTKTISSVPLFS